MVTSNPTKQTMSAPFHVLMLPGSKVPGASSNGNGRDGEATGVANGDGGANRADPQPPAVDTGTSPSPAPLGAEAVDGSTAVPSKLPSPPPPPPPPEVSIPEDDYLLTRHRHRVSSVHDASNDGGTSSSSKSKANATAKSSSGGDNNVDDEDAQKAVPVCTPIEIAIINCCDCGPSKKRKERRGSTEEVGRRPTDDDYDGSSSPMEEDGSVEGNSSVEYSGAATTTSGIGNGDGNNSNQSKGDQLASSSLLSSHPSLPSQLGHLVEGKEGQFAALIAQHCHTVSDRALALAVLERTMEHDRALLAAQEKDSTNNIGKKRKREECSTKSDEKDASAIGESSQSDEKKSSEDSSNPSGMEGIADDKTKSLSDADAAVSVSDGKKCNGKNEDSSNSRANVSRMANFLSAGGLKILSQWLVDSFTPIQKPVSQSPSKKGKDSGNKRKRQKEPAEVKTEPETSPTGPLILPLLSILQSIPFQYDLITECKINKQVKKLKKNVERVIGADSSKKSAIEKKLSAMKAECSHPNSGGMPVIEVYRQIETLIDTWIKAMNEEKKRPENATSGSADNSSKQIGKQENNVYRSLQSKMSDRLESLSSYEAGKAPKPSWLAKLDPKASAGKGKGIDAEEVARQRQMKEKAAASAKAAKEKAEQEKRLLEAKRRKIQLQEELNAENAAIEENKKRLEQYRRRLQEESEQRRAATAEVEKPDQKDKPKARRSRKVTWADQHSDNSTKLAEVREFVQHEDYASEEDARRRSESEERSDSTPEEDEYDVYDYDEETQASDSVEEDEFDEDPNLSQEEEEESESAGFTFETNELRR